ncbi:MAG TPA: hypothetical protein VF470_00915, partial [Sphingomicrobium sp.]
MRLPALVLSPAVLACVLLAAGPAAAQSPPPPPAIDPCQLLTAAEVSAALGQTVEPGRLSDNGLT